ncbi:MAG TPA: hypothetical protein VHZ53_05030 [Steroidobacteraceae bacterium]|nr:hypothetical protein [Steroidobacteraceae bacterium]
MKRFAKRCLARLGYQVVPLPNWKVTRALVEQRGYRLASWAGADGRVDVAAYTREQERGNRAKISQVWTNEANLRSLARWLKERGIGPKFVLCHGTRNGFEQRIFNEEFGCEIIGTEISSTAAQFPMTVQADFHERRAEWAGRADVVYSNSLDHAYDPSKALNAWADCVRDGGVIVLEKASDSDPRGVSDLDPFGIALPNLLLFIMDSLGESASLRALLEVPAPKSGASYHKMIVIQIDRRRTLAM